jgi:hypothetical protein
MGGAARMFSHAGASQSVDFPAPHHTILAEERIMTIDAAIPNIRIVTRFSCRV